MVLYDVLVLCVCMCVRVSVNLFYVFVCFVCELLRGVVWSVLVCIVWGVVCVCKACLCVLVATYCVMLYGLFDALLCVFVCVCVWLDLRTCLSVFACGLLCGVVACVRGGYCCLV